MEHFHQFQEETVCYGICNSSANLVGKLFAKIIDFIWQKFGRGGIVLYGDVEITRALVFLNPS